MISFDSASRKKWMSAVTKHGEECYRSEDCRVRPVPPGVAGRLIPPAFSVDFGRSTLRCRLFVRLSDFRSSISRLAARFCRSIHLYCRPTLSFDFSPLLSNFAVRFADIDFVIRLCRLMFRFRLSDFEFPISTFRVSRRLFAFLSDFRFNFLDFVVRFCLSTYSWNFVVQPNQIAFSISTFLWSTFRFSRSTLSPDAPSSFVYPRTRHGRGRRKLSDRVCLVGEIAGVSEEWICTEIN